MNSCQVSGISMVAPHSWQSEMTNTHFLSQTLAKCPWQRNFNLFWWGLKGIWNEEHLKITLTKHDVLLTRYDVSFFFLYNINSTGPSIISWEDPLFIKESPDKIQDHPWREYIEEMLYLQTFLWDHSSLVYWCHN